MCYERKATSVSCSLHFSCERQGWGSSNVSRTIWVSFSVPCLLISLVHVSVDLWLFPSLVRKLFMYRENNPLSIIFPPVCYTLLMVFLPCTLFNVSRFIHLSSHYFCILSLRKISLLHKLQRNSPLFSRKILLGSPWSISFTAPSFIKSTHNLGPRDLHRAL